MTGMRRTRRALSTTSFWRSASSTGLSARAVVTTVDLDDEPDVIPGDVEIDPPARWTRTA